MRFGEQGFEKAFAMLHGAFGLEQRRDIDLAVDTEQFREIERGERGLRILAFGDQHPDRGIGIDMVKDLRHGEELANGGGVLDRQRGEIGAERLRVVEQGADPQQRGLAGKIEPVFGVDPPTDGVLQLRCVHPEMDAAHAKAVGTHRGGEHEELPGTRLAGAARAILQHGDKRRERNQLCRVVSRQPVRGIRKGSGIAEVALKQTLHCGSMDMGGAQNRQCGMRGIDLFELRRVARQPQRLFAQPVVDAGRPADVGPPVHVVANPAGETERQRLQLAPTVWPAPRRCREEQGIERIARILRPAECRHCLAMLMVQGYRRAARIGDADRRFGHRAAAGGPGNRIALRGREQEGRVGGKDDMEQRVRPAPGKGRKLALIAEQRLKGLVVVVRRDWREQIEQAVGAAQQALAFQLGDQPCCARQRKAASFQCARNIEAELEHRIEQRRLGGSQMQHAKAFTQVSGAVHGR